MLLYPNYLLTSKNKKIDNCNYEQKGNSNYRYNGNEYLNKHTHTKRFNKWQHLKLLFQQNPQI